jgi:hypothetical protein
MEHGKGSEQLSLKGRIMKTGFLATSLLLLVVGCGGVAIDMTIREYHAAASQVKLGDSREKVVSVLMPTQRRLSASKRKEPEHFMQDGVSVEIYYFRSRRQPDGLTTDDEFTPYVFVNDKLVAVGWTALGGPKSHGQTTPTTHVNVDVHDYGY